MKGFIVYSDYDTRDEKTLIRLFGRLENGNSFVSTFNFSPYFFIEEKDLKKATPLLGKFKHEKTELRNFKGEKVIKIIGSIPADLGKLASALHKKKIDTYEADVKPAMRFMIDNNILGIVDLEGDYKTADRVDRFYENPDLKHVAEFLPKLKLVSLDIESDKKTGELFCIGLYGENYKKNFIISDKKIADAISCKDEEELLEKFKQELVKYDPDLITGWNVIDFDLAYLKERFAKHKITFDIGRTNENVRLKIESDFFRSSTADIPGRQVLDALNLLRDPFIKEAPSIKKAEFESYKLEDVAQALLGEGKFIKGKGRHEEIEKLFRKDPAAVVEYNLQDCKLAYNIIEKTKTIELAVERSTLTGMPLNKITASVAAFDSLYIREARRKGLVSPTTRFEEKGERIKGGYVMDSKPGLFSNVLVLDFKSLYPSIIKTFNIDPASLLDKKEKGAIESPNKAYFKNVEGVLPGIIEKLHLAREKAKKEKRELASYAIKIIMNSFFGVLANPSCRYFSIDMANAITHFGQFIIKLTAQKIEEKGHKVIYMDTDSVFIETQASKGEAEKLGHELPKYVNSFYDEYVSQNYKRKSYLELQFDKLYLAFMMPPIRHSEAGSKKRYAGLLEKSGKEEVEVVGLEAIRGDWTEAAQEFQMELLDKIFHKEEFVNFIRSYVKKLKDGKLDEKLVYTKSITKPLEEYTKTTPPHVKAARQLDKLESNVIKYYITTEGPEPIQKVKHKLDYEHYIEKQIKPIADTLLFFFDKKFDDIVASSKQMKLF